MNTKKQYWLLVAGLILLMKFFCYWLDQTPMFFMSDSMDFIETALTGKVAPAKSFVYGYVVKYLALSPHSLAPLLTAQVFFSAFSVIILVGILVRFLRVSHGIALAMGLLCAVEPLQLMYERYIMTETMALFFLACYLYSIFYYFEKRALVLLVIVHLLGCALISFRLSHLPIVQANAVFLPVVASVLYFRSAGLGAGRKRWLFGAFITSHLLVSTLSFQIPHTMFKLLTGRMANHPPAYSSVTGFQFLAFWSPLVTVDDFPRADWGRIILAKTTYPLASRHDRLAQWVQEGGLLRSLRNVVGDEMQAERFAKETALNILERDPLGVVLLYLKTYTDYWHTHYLKLLLPLDRGEDPLPMDFLRVLKEKFDLDAGLFPKMITLTNAYFYTAWPWYLVVLCATLMAGGLVCLAVSSGQLFVYRMIVFVFTGFLTLSACHWAVVRYLHPLGWIIFLSFGPLVEFGKIRCVGLADATTTKEGVSLQISREVGWRCK